MRGKDIQIFFQTKILIKYKLHRCLNIIHIVGDKVCPGTEREQINSSRTDTENAHVEIDNGTNSTTKD